MAEIYQGSCTACGAVTERTFGSYEAVLVDEPAGPPYAHPEDPQMVVLAHPNQLEILREVGISGQAAHWGGRMVEIDEVVCRSCGRMFEVRRLSAGLPALGLWGALGAVVVVLAVSIGAGMLVGGEWQGVVAGGCLFVFLLGGTEVGLGLYIRCRYPARAARVATPMACPDCGCGQFDRLGGGRGELSVRVKCTACGERTVKYRDVATA